MMGCTSRFKLPLAAVCLLLVAVSTTVAGATREALATVVLFNSNDPDSKNLAQYYALRRNIPPAQVVGLDCPEMEEIQRTDYEKTIAAPLRKLFRARGWWKTGLNSAGKEIVTLSNIRFLAIVRGMPLKIAQDPSMPPATLISGLPAVMASRNEASVDSELTILSLPLTTSAGVFPNPYFQRFTPVLEDSVYPGLMLPARLDGPTPSIVRAMIDDSLTAEKEGLTGWSYVDGRGITSGGYAEGDQWMKNVVVAMRAQGLPVIFDNTPPTFPPGYPITDAAVYYGWYADSVNGPFADPTFQFRPGAIAVHLHSFSASTLRSTTANWCGPLLARGAAATLGNVYEPYLSLTANFDIFQDRLMAGFTLAESAWMSQRALSWMGVVVGDPLYRPYATWRSIDSSPPNVWQSYRKIVRQSSGNVLQAADALRAEGEKTKESFFMEAVGAAQMDAENWTGALESFDAAEKLTSNPAVRIRLDLETIASLLALGKKSEASAIALAASSGLPAGPRKELFSKFIASPLSTPGTQPGKAEGPVTEGLQSPPPATDRLSPTSSPSATATPEAVTPTPTPLPPPPLPELRP